MTEKLRLGKEFTETHNLLPRQPLFKDGKRAFSVSDTSQFADNLLHKQCLQDLQKTMMMHHSICDISNEQKALERLQDVCFQLYL